MHYKHSIINRMFSTSWPLYSLNLFSGGNERGRSQYTCTNIYSAPIMIIHVTLIRPILQFNITIPWLKKINTSSNFNTYVVSLLVITEVFPALIAGHSTDKISFSLNRLSSILLSISLPLVCVSNKNKILQCLTVQYKNLAVRYYNYDFSLISIQSTILILSCLSNKMKLNTFSLHRPTHSHKITSQYSKRLERKECKDTTYKW